MLDKQKMKMIIKKNQTKIFLHLLEMIQPQDNHFIQILINKKINVNLAQIGHLMVILINEDINKNFKSYNIYYLSN